MSAQDPPDLQLCEICGKPDSPFGYGPPLHQQTIWRCGEHRLEGPVPRLPLFPRFLELDPPRSSGAWSTNRSRPIGRQRATPTCAVIAGAGRQPDSARLRNAPADLGAPPLQRSLPGRA